MVKVKRRRAHELDAREKMLQQRGIAWEDSSLFGGFEPATEAPKRLTLSNNPICRADSQKCYE